MSGAALGLVLAAAVLHATWNALAKRGRDQVAFLWSSVALASVVLAPAGLRVAHDEGFPPAAVPYVAATILIHAVYFWALGRAYRSGEFSLVYPVARGLGVSLVPLAAVPLFGERLSPRGAAGVALVVLGILGLHLGQHGLRGALATLARVGPGMRWAALTGLTIAGYSLVDKAGVGLLHPVPYITLLGLGTTVVLLPVVLARGETLRQEWRLNGRTIVAAAAMNLTAYLLVLFAFRLSKVGYVVATREVSIVLSAVIGSTVLGEGGLGPRLVAAAVVFAGVACVALAR